MASRCGTKSHRFLFISVCSPRPPASHSPLSQHTRTLSIPAAAVWPVRGIIQCFNVCCLFVHFYLFNNSPPPCCLSTLHPPQLIAFFCSCFDCLLVCVYLLCFYLVMISYVTHLRGGATERHHLVPRITPTLWIILHKWGSSQLNTESRTGAKLKHIQDNCSVVLTLAGLSRVSAQCVRHSKLYSQIQGPPPSPQLSSPPVIIVFSSTPSPGWWRPSPSPGCGLAHRPSVCLGQQPR